jgi:aldehyde:ferredoxin oxidoreductase
MVDPHYGGPEYETIAALGSNCGIDNLEAIAKGNELSGAYGLDSISCGNTIAFAMECYERRLLTRQETFGVDLTFGNASAMLQMIEQIAFRKGLGNLLAEGVAQASRKLGPATEELALHIKGQEIPMHEPRWKQGMGIGYIMSPTGADHCHNTHDSSYTEANPLLDDLKALSILEPLPIDDLSPAKVKLIIQNSLWIHFLNCAVCCYFVMVYGQVGLERVAQLVKAVTGWDMSIFELIKVGERAVNLARCFNLREGLAAQDDDMPRRFFTAQTSGPLKGVEIDRVAFQKAKEFYYDIMGWPQGLPSPGKLAELGLDWVIPLVVTE